MKNEEKPNAGSNNFGNKTLKTLKLDKELLRYIVVASLFVVLFWWALGHFQSILKFAGKIIAVFLPFIIGSAIAFVMNVLLKPLERFWMWLWRKSKKGFAEKLKRPVCLILCTLILLGLIFALLFMIIPELKQTVLSFVDGIPEYIEKLNLWWNKIVSFGKKFGFKLPKLSVNPAKLKAVFGKFMKKSSNAVVNKTIIFTTSVFSSVVNIILSFVFALYLLAQKEKIGVKAKKALKAVFKKEKVNRIVKFLHLVGKTFENFITGQFTEAVIIGILCFIGMVIFRFPYAAIISVLVGSTALIPMFGAFIGTGVGAFLILLVSPAKAFWFVVFIIVLQQLEGNLIYPKVVGKSVGLPGILVLVAVTVGGKAFGIVGMLCAVPVCAVLYCLFKNFVERKADNR